MLVICLFVIHTHAHTHSPINLIALKIPKLCGCTTGMCILLFAQYVEHCLFLTYMSCKEAYGCSFER